jgi:hypothetical protein
LLGRAIGTNKHHHWHHSHVNLPQKFLLLGNSVTSKGGIDLVIDVVEMDNILQLGIGIDHICVQENWLQDAQMSRPDLVTL